MLVSAPLVVLVPAIVVAGSLSQSWNGLSFTAAAEIAGYARSGAALGLQQASLSLAYTSALDSAQWIENTDLDGSGVDANVYGTLRRHVVNITTRATYAFSPTMTLEAYLQPFVAVGKYGDIRKLARP